MTYDRELIKFELPYNLIQEFLRGLEYARWDSDDRLSSIYSVKAKIEEAASKIADREELEKLNQRREEIEKEIAIVSARV
jgi:hypothetical protein